MCLEKPDQNASIGIQSAEQHIKKSEGLETTMYLDKIKQKDWSIKEIPTVCFGYNLYNKDARSKVEEAGGNYDSIMKKDPTE